MRIRRLSLFLAACLLLTLIPAPSAAAASGSIRTSDGNIYTADQLGLALQEISENGTIWLSDGTFSATSSEQLRLDTPGVTLRGEGPAQTIIDAGSFSVSGQAAFLVAADEVHIEGLTIRASGENGNVSALKYSNIGTGRPLQGGSLRDTALSSAAGHALNVHGADGLEIDGVQILSAGKLSIAIANSPEVTIRNTETAAGGWGADAGIMHRAGSVDYSHVSRVVFGEGNRFACGGRFYSEYTDADGSLGSPEGQFQFAASDVHVYREPGSYVYTAEIPAAARLRAGFDPLRYDSLAEVLASELEPNDVVQFSTPVVLAEDAPLTIEQDGITLQGVGEAAISGPLLCSADGVQIRDTDLSGVRIQVSEGVGALDLSHNYWGGGAPSAEQLPEEIADLVTGTDVYYKEDTMLPEDLNTYVPPTGGGTLPVLYDIRVASTQNGTLKSTPTHAAAGDYVTLTAFPEPGYAIAVLKATDAAGQSLPLTELGNGRFTFTMPASDVLVTASFAADGSLPFGDVAADDWFYAPVAYVWHKGLMVGTGSERFAPRATLSRATFVQTLYRLAGSPAADGPAFEDVAADAWYAPAVRWAAQAGIVHGLDSGRFAPDAPITREQAACLLFRYAAYRGKDVSARGALDAFRDGNTVSDWAREAVAWAVGEALLAGDGNRRLSPGSGALRCEAAQLLRQLSLAIK